MTKETETLLGSIATGIADIKANAVSKSDLKVAVLEGFQDHNRTHHKGVSWGEVGKAAVALAIIAGAIIGAVTLG